MSKPERPAVALCGRLCRPQRIGVFGRRGVGKTTLLTMLYREAVGGRLPGLRLAAGDARTAAYLGDKILQLESGQPLPATLDETELRLHLYHQGRRVELVLLDYQGEHVALGRREAVREFLHTCDAVWLCLDAPAAGDSAARLVAEQEAEQIVEDYLATRHEGEPHRPMALVVTKGDLIRGDSAQPALGMTRHTLETHCPWHGVFTISSLGADGLTPHGLDAPLAWLAESLRAQDEARLERLWAIAPSDLAMLGQGTAAFARRYPGEPATNAFRKRLLRRQWNLRSRRVLATAAAVLAVFLGFGVYDALGARALQQRLSVHEADPAAQRADWGEYLAWYPTRHVYRQAEVPGQLERIDELDREIRERRRLEELGELRRKADDADADAEVVWATFLQFRDDYPEHDLDSEGQALRARIKQASDTRRQGREQAASAERDRKGVLALRDLEQAETKQTLPALIASSAKLAREHAGSSSEQEMLRRRTGYLRRLDEHDYESARDYSTRSPANFFTRRQKYQHYLDHHPDGAFVTASRSALAAVASEWDRADYLAIRDHYVASPAKLDELRSKARAYLAAHAEGRFVAPIKELLRWVDRVGETNEYTITLKSGSFSKKVAHMVSRGASLSVEIEVAGVRYGPSSIVTRSYEPEWDYEFPRKVKWKSGDAVRIIVTDNYFWKRRVSDTTFDEDPFALQKLAGEVEVSHGSLTFASDFTMPSLPKAE